MEAMNPESEQTIKIANLMRQVAKLRAQRTTLSLLLSTAEYSGRSKRKRETWDQDVLHALVDCSEKKR